MSLFGKLALVPDKPHWLKFRTALAKEVLAKHGSTTVAFTRDPSRYPCLVAGILVPIDPAKEGTITDLKVACCFVYADDAKALLSSTLEAEFEAQQSAIDTALQLSDLLDDELDDKDDDYAPSQLGTMLLALAVELRAVGALKQDKLMATYSRIASYLEHNVADTYQDDILTIFNKVMDLPDVG